MDLPQIVLLTIIIAVGVILIVIGVQIIGLLKDAKETLRKTDLVIEDLGFLTRSLTRGGTALGNMLTSLQSGMQLVGLVTKVLAPTKSKKID
ncbi:MAG: hypothetical protein DPW11_03090 [bacterium]|nr:hypothetical protein [Candidatus Microgenomates bacterium CPR3]MCQ3944736.1 hypothetical protein [bacterium]RIK51953.1 MAG: hypothetical protein DCC61_01020 [Candidatus Microgenomates bacterium]